MTYVPLHCHSDKSFLDGHGKPERYLERAAQLGIKSFAATDHGNLCGLLDFYEAAQKYDINFIPGLEAYQARKTRFDQDEEERAGKANDDLEQRGPYHLTVLAKNETGYKNLIKLSSQSYLTGYYGKGRIDHQLLSEYSEGLIVLSGCLNGEVSQALLRGDYQFALSAAKKMQDIVGRDNYYIEVQNHGLQEQQYILDRTIDIAKRIGAPLIPTGDCHYVHKEDAYSHDILLCISVNSRVAEENRFKFFGPEFYLKSYDEMARIFPEEWLANSVEVGNKVNVKLNLGEFYFPDFPIPEGYSYASYLEEKTWAGLKERYGWDLPNTVVDRAKYELGIIQEMGFHSYFLVVADLVEWARQNGIRVGIGRGSAAGSIVSYALKVTGLDPLRFNLPFERFLVPGRKAMPDVDLDFSDRYRDRVIEYARQKYGIDHVANIATFSEIGARSAVRDTARVLGFDYAVGDKVAKLVPPPIQGFAPSLEEALENDDLKKLYDTDADTKTIIDTAKGIEGVVRQSGIHPAGVVIARSDITDFAPVMQKGPNSPIVTQWEDDRVEQCGLLKIDFLGLRNLTIIDIAIKNIEDRYGIIIDTDKIPLDDPDTYATLSAGNTVGLFQIEGTGIRNLLMAVKPDCLEDISAVNALYRPGPLGSGMDKVYVARKHGREKTIYAHPLLDSVLKDTYGLMIYQEDILSVSRTLAGFDAGEADDLRKACGKKLKDKIAAIREKFVKGCRQTNNIDPKISNKIYSDIEYFGAYGFNLCVTGETEVLSSQGLKSILEIKSDLNNNKKVFLYSWNKEILIDECLEVIDQGVQDVFSLEFEDGSMLETTLSHRFLCSHDYSYHTVEEILSNNYDIITIDSKQ